MPCHHALAEALHAYIAAAGIAADRKGFLFRTSRGHVGTALSDQPMTQPDAWRMIRRRALAVGIMAPIGNHSFRATGITAYLSNGGALEHAQEMAAHESPRTTKLSQAPIANPHRWTEATSYRAAEEVHHQP
jgi:integrase